MKNVQKTRVSTFALLAAAVFAISAFLPFQLQAFAERCRTDNTKVCASGYYEEDGYLIGWIISGDPIEEGDDE